MMADLFVSRLANVLWRNF